MTHPLLTHDLHVTHLPANPPVRRLGDHPDRYREHLTEILRAINRSNSRAIASSLEPGTRDEDVAAFAEDTWQKRFDKLQSQLEFVVPAFDDFADLLDRYIDAVPTAAYDTSVSDGSRMLRWLRMRHELSAEQRDYVTCQETRHVVEELARSQRLQHVRFQERYSLVERWIDKLSFRSPLNIYLNPIRAWTTFHSTALLDNQMEPPTHVLFFAHGGEIATAVLELESQVHLNELADFQPCTLAQWFRASATTDRRALLQLTRDLARLGLVAFG